MQQYDITFLGTGTSIGIPVPGCGCRVCRSVDRRNRRTRTSLLVESAGKRILIDTSPEFRLQALKAGIDDLDAVFWTHAHADHVHGLDDLRALTWNNSIPGYANAGTVAEIRQRFDYLWKETQKGGGKARIVLKEVGDGDVVEVSKRPFRKYGEAPTAEPEADALVRAGIPEEPLRVVPLPVWHGKLPIFGWRCGPAAYITDASAIPDSTYPLLEGLKILIVGALHFKPHPTHFNVQRALEEIKKIRPERAYLTHISHEVSHRILKRKTPGDVSPARDGLRLRTFG